MSIIAGFPVHEAAELFPLITGPDFEALVADIRENGQMERQRTGLPRNG